MEYLLLIIGFILLIKGADFFVDGAASTAYKFHISTTIVGLTIVALGTSLPEFAVSLSASIAGSNALAISNVAGSNIFNTLVVVGCSALLAPFIIPKEVISRDLIFNIICTAVLLGAVLLGHGMLTRIAGAFLLVMLVWYIWKLIQDARNNPLHEDEEEEKKILPVWQAVVYMVGGAIAIMVGGNLTVNAAKVIAASLGMTETLIGLTVVSVGTSLPELVTSVAAARKGESGLSLGNAIGSNILNILFILGTSSVIHPLFANMQNIIDMVLLLVIACGVFAMAKISNKMDRVKGVVFVLLYCCYLAYIIIR